MEVEIIIIRRNDINKRNLKRWDKRIRELKGIGEI